MSRKKKTIKERLLSKIVVNDCTGCWNWNGFKSGGKYGGYAMIKVDGKNMLATRVSYSEFNGAIPDGLFVLHKCDDPSCINPSHLFAGTQSENMIDMHKKSRHYSSLYRSYDHNGESKNIAQIARCEGICQLALRYQLVKRNKSVNEAISTVKKNTGEA